MAMSANSGGAAAAIGVILLAIGAPAGPAGQPALAADAPPTVTGGGVTLHSISTSLPAGDRIFPGGVRADAINKNCLACHSAGMVLTQPSLSRAGWQDEVGKMRNTYKAPVAAEDVPAIVDYLASLSGGNSRASQK